MASPHVDRDVTLHRLLHRHCAGEGLQCASEDHHDTVAQALHLLPTACGNSVAEKPEMSAPQRLGFVVTKGLEYLRGALQVGKQKRNGPDARAALAISFAARGKVRTSVFTTRS